MNVVFFLLLLNRLVTLTREKLPLHSAERAAVPFFEKFPVSLFPFPLSTSKRSRTEASAHGASPQRLANGLLNGRSSAAGRPWQHCADAFVRVTARRARGAERGNELSRVRQLPPSPCAQESFVRETSAAFSV